MKKLLITLISFLPIICYANTIDGTLESPNEIFAGDNFDVIFSINTNERINSIDGILKYDYTKIELEEVESLDRLDCILKSSLACSSANYITGNNEIVAFHFKSKNSLKIGSSLTISLNNVSYNEKNDNDNYSVNVKVLSNKNNNTDLKYLKINNTDVLNSLSYTTNLSEILITAEAEKKGTSITGLGNKKLKMGINKFNIVTTSESGLKKAYVISVTREEKTIDDSDNNNDNNQMNSVNSEKDIENKNTDKAENNNSKKNNLNNDDNIKNNPKTWGNIIDKAKQYINDNKSDNKNSIKVVLPILLIIIIIIALLLYKRSKGLRK